MARSPLRALRSAAGMGLLLAVGVLAPPAHGGPPELVPLPAQPAGVPWPTRAWPARPPGPDVDRDALDAALARAFTPVGRARVRNTRAVVVVHRGAIVAERYALGFTADTRFHSWSMAKTVTQALAGILVRQGVLDPDASAPVPAWRAPGDPRRVLTLANLLHMNTGLALSDGEGGEGPDSMVARLLFGAAATDPVSVAVQAPLVDEPGTRWAYSTGTSTLLADVVQRHAGGSPEAMRAFLHRELLDPLGMGSAVMEFDAAGTFMGGGFFWADARDWARFITLYLRDGIWEGRRILPEGWVDWSRTPAPAANNATFGAHLWVNREPAGDDQFRILPGAPESAFCAAGAYGQYACAVPTHDLVLVRLGEMQGLDWPQVTAPLADIVAAFPPLPEAAR